MATIQIKNGQGWPGPDVQVRVFEDGSIGIQGIVVGDFTPTGLTKAGRITMLAIDDSQWWEAPPVALADRNNIEIQNPSTAGSNMIWNYDNAAPISSGFQVPPGASRSLAIRGSIPVYVRMVSGSETVVVEELA